MITITTYTSILIRLNTFSFIAPHRCHC